MVGAAFLCSGPIVVAFSQAGIEHGVVTERGVNGDKVPGPAIVAILVALSRLKTSSLSESQGRDLLAD